MQPDDHPPAKPRYWFPAKRYGWGWGPPSTWQGWVVLAGYLALLLALIVFVPADRYPNWCSLGLGTLVATLIAICWWTGEPPKWRWGGD
jgi:hypothetical protein